MLGRGLRLFSDERWNSKGWADKKSSACASFRSPQKQTSNPSHYIAHPICDFSDLSGRPDGRNNPIYPSEAWKPHQTSYPAQTLNTCLPCTGQHSWSIDSDACANFREAGTITVSYDSYSKHHFSESRRLSIPDFCHCCLG